jgi:hypothetical protein
VRRKAAVKREAGGEVEQGSAFVSPRIVEAIANGSAPADLTMLARSLRHGWAAQEHKLGACAEQDYFSSIPTPKFDKEMVKLAEHILDTKAAHCCGRKSRGRLAR